MPAMTIDVTPEMADFIAGELEKGDYASASEVVRDALRILRRDREIENEKAAILRRAVELGLKQAEYGEFSSRTVMEIAESVLQENGTWSIVRLRRPMPILPAF